MIDNKQYLEEEVIKLVSDFFGKRIRLNLGTSLSDLKPLSEDIDDFMKAYYHQFGVNMDEYDYYDYFYEDVLPLSWLFSLIQKKVLKRKKKPLQVADLVRFAESKKWRK